MKFLGPWVAAAVSVGCAIWLVDGISAVGGSVVGPAACALVLSIANATIKPILKFLSFPLNVATLGFSYLVLNATMLELASYISLNIFHAGIVISSFGAAFWGAIVISIASVIAYVFVGDDDK